MWFRHYSLRFWVHTTNIKPFPWHDIYSFHNILHMSKTDGDPKSKNILIKIRNERFAMRFMFAIVAYIFLQIERTKGERERRNKKKPTNLFHTYLYKWEKEICVNVFSEFPLDFWMVFVHLIRCLCACVRSFACSHF